MGFLDVGEGGAEDAVGEVHESEVERGHQEEEGEGKEVAGAGFHPAEA